MIEQLIKRRKALKAKLKSRAKVLAGWQSFGHPSITEVFAKTGIDFLGIDLEHSTISQAEAQRIIAATQGEGSLSIPRIATHNYEMVKRLLDSGADGIMVPLVNTPQEVREILSWCKYPPAGRRSFGVSRAQGYGLDYNRYTKSWNDSFLFFIQIESVEGVSNIEEILAAGGIDGVMIGPYDISGSLGVPGQLDHPKVRACCKTVITACKKYNISCGTQIVKPDSANIKRAWADGFTFVVLGSDLFFLWKWAEAMQGFVKSIGGRQ